MRRLIFAALALNFVAACQTGTTELTEEQKASIAAEVNAVHAEFWNAWREAEVDEVMAYYLDSPSFGFSHVGEMIRSFSEFEELVQSAFAIVESQTITITDTHTTVLSPNVVCVMDRGVYAFTDTAGVTGPEAGFASTIIWILHNAEWKVQHAHTSEDAAEAS